MKITLVKKLTLTGNIKSFIFKPERLFNWKAGQYLIAKIEHKNIDLRGKMRFITISSAPFEKHVMITTRIFGKKASSFKKALDNLELGEEIEIKGPDGDLFIDDLKKQYVFIAGGVGITPFRSILKQLDFENKMASIILLYANRNNKILFKDELEQIAQKFSRFKIIYFISPGKITVEKLKKLNIDFKKNIFFISGPENMIYKIKGLLNSLGVKDENIKEDYFTGYKKI